MPDTYEEVASRWITRMEGERFLRDKKQNRLLAWIYQGRARLHSQAVLYAEVENLRERVRDANAERGVAASLLSAVRKGELSSEAAWEKYLRHLEGRPNA